MNIINKMEPIRINPTDVLNMLAEGKTREEIRIHYGLNKKQLKALFLHSRLKGKKTKKVDLGFIIVEDEQDNGLLEPGNSATTTTATGDNYHYTLHIQPEPTTTDPMVDTEDKEMEKFFEEFEQKEVEEELSPLSEEELPDWMK